MLRIYLTNLGKYNEGILQGEWLDLPATDDEIEACKERIGIDDRYEEWFITDYETDVHGLTVDEYDNLNDLNDLAEAIEEDPAAAEALIFFGYDTAEEIAEGLKDVIYITTLQGAEDEDTAIGYYFAEECGMLDKVPDDIKRYFDYEAYGRDIRLNGSFYTTEAGEIYEVVR